MSEQPDVKFTVRVRTCWQHQDETFDATCLYCRIAELAAELSSVKALLDAATREGVLAESLADTERAGAALREVGELPRYKTIRTSPTWVSIFRDDAAGLWVKHDDILPILAKYKENLDDK